MIGFAEVAALITVLGAAIYGLGLLGVAGRSTSDGIATLPLRCMRYL
jgi:hypothetical protein